MEYIPEQKGKSIYKVYMIYFICMVLFCFVRIMSAYGWLDFGSSRWGDVFYTVLIQVGLMFVLPCILYSATIKVTPYSVFRTCNYNKVTWQIVFTSLLMGVLTFFINIIVSTFFTGVINFTGYKNPVVAGATGADMTIGNFFIDVLLIAVLPALCEEFMHRGILLQGTKHMGFTKAIVMSSVLFGLLHFNINQVSYAIVLGMIMGFVAVVSKNIWPAIIIHFTNNFISVYLDYASANNWPLGNVYTDMNNLFSKMSLWAIVLVVSIILVIVVVMLLWLVTILYKQSILRKVNKAIAKAYKSTDYDVQNSPIVMDRNKMIRNMLATSTMLNLDYEEMKSPIETVMPKQTKVYRTTYKDNIFLVGSLCLGFLITLFTFIWGFI